MKISIHEQGTRLHRDTSKKQRQNFSFRGKVLDHAKIRGPISSFFLDRMDIVHCVIGMKAPGFGDMQWKAHVFNCI